MVDDIRRIDIDTAGGTGFVDFKVDDLIMTKQSLLSGIFTAYARVLGVGEQAITILCHNDFPKVDILEWVRVGNENDLDRQAFLRLVGSGDGSPRMEYRARVDSFEAMNDISTLIMLHGKLDGIQHPTMGALEGDGTLCTNFNGLGTMWVKVGDEIKESGAEFKVHADEISARVTSKTYESYVEQTDNAISARVTSEIYESYVEQTDNAISQTVRKDGIISSINQSAEQVTIKASKIRLVGNTTLSGALTVDGRIKAQYLEVESIVAKKLRTATSGARLEINHEANIMKGFARNGSEVFQIGGVTSGEAYFSISSRMNIPNGRNKVIKLDIDGLNMSSVGGEGMYYGKYLRSGIELSSMRGVANSSQSAVLKPGQLLVSAFNPIDVRFENLPSGRAHEAHIQALPRGSVFQDTGQNANGCYMLRIRG